MVRCDATEEMQCTTFLKGVVTAPERNQNEAECMQS